MLSRINVGEMSCSGVIFMWRNDNILAAKNGALWQLRNGVTIDIIVISIDDIIDDIIINVAYWRIIVAYWRIVYYYCVCVLLLLLLLLAYYYYYLVLYYYY